MATTVQRQEVIRLSAPPAAPLTFAEFFAGIGLMRLGLERAGWRVAFANDIDPKKLEMYHVAFPDADEHFLLKDVHELTAEELPTTDLATASFPCTDLSLAGSRQGLGGKQSSAFWGFMRTLEIMGERRPPLVLLENVTGFLTSHGGEDFTDAMLALNGLGYAVDPFIIDAASFVPQSRKRLFVVGSRRRLRAAEPAGSGYLFGDDEARPKGLSDFVSAHRDIRWSLRELPRLPHARTRLADVIEDLPAKSPVWWSAARVQYLLNQMSERHRQAVATMARNGKREVATAFRRIRYGKSMAEVRTDGIAGCLRTPKGGSARQILIVAERGKVRARLLTARECARLMGADEFPIAAPLNQALFGFGDAVCVDVVEWIARNYLNPAIAELMSRPAAQQYGG
jgi:DNA (cytosine-5)-methyltransferase 1